MDDATKKNLEEKCILKLKKITEDGYSKEYIEGYMRAYVDGFSEGSTYGMKRIEEIIKNAYS